MNILCYFILSSLTPPRASVRLGHLFVGPPVSHNAPLPSLGVHVKPDSHRLSVAADNMAAVEVALSARRVVQTGF